MAKMSVGGCRIRDVVRDSKIHWDALSKIGRNFDADHDRQQAGRVFPRTQFGEIGECDELIQITSKNSEYLSTEKSLFDQQSTQGFEPKVKLPTFDGSCLTLDFLDWFDMFEDYFEAVNLPDAVKCKLVASKLKGVARIWWKELQNHTFSVGEDLINSWPRMRELLLKKFLHTSCLTYFHNQPNKQENEDDVKHTNCSTICPLQSVKAKQEEIDAGGSSKDDALSTGRNDSFMPTTCLAKFPNQLNKLEEAVKWIEMQPTSFVATSNLMKGITLKEQKDGAGHRVDTKHIFNTSENGKELGCTTKLHDAKDEQSRQQIHLKSNNIDLLVGELLMVSFDPGGVSSRANTILSLTHKADAELRLIGDSAAQTGDASVQTRLKVKNVMGLVLKRRLELVDLSNMTRKDQDPDTAFDIAIEAINIYDVDVGHIPEQGKLLIIKVDTGINSWTGTFISSFSFKFAMEKLALNLVYENVLWPCVEKPMSRFVPTCVDAYLTPFIKAYLYGFLSKFKEIGGQPNIYIEYISIRVTMFVGVQFARVYLTGIIEACESALCIGLFAASLLYPFEVPLYAHPFSISLVPFGLKTTELVSLRSYCLRVIGSRIGGNRLNLERVDKRLRYVKLERKWLLLGYIENIFQYLTMFASPVSQNIVLTFVPLIYNPAMFVLGVGQVLLRYIYDVSYLKLRLLRCLLVEHLRQISSVMKAAIVILTVRVLCVGLRSSLVGEEKRSGSRGKNDENMVYISYKRLPEAVRPDCVLPCAYGTTSFRVLSCDKENGIVRSRYENTLVLSWSKIINLLGSVVDFRALIRDDKECALKWGVLGIFKMIVVPIARTCSNFVVFFTRIFGKGILEGCNSELNKDHALDDHWIFWMRLFGVVGTKIHEDHGVARQPSAREFFYALLQLPGILPSDFLFLLGGLYTEHAGLEASSEIREAKGVHCKREQKVMRTNNGKSSNKSCSITLEEIHKYFDVPMIKAAKELNVGLIVLKKRCRELNIARWPHRKIKSLTSLIDNAKEMGHRKEIALDLLNNRHEDLLKIEDLRLEDVMLEEHKRMMLETPEMELTERAKKLRQALLQGQLQ